MSCSKGERGGAEEVPGEEVRSTASPARRGTSSCVDMDEGCDGEGEKKSVSAVASTSSLAAGEKVRSSDEDEEDNVLTGEVNEFINNTQDKQGRKRKKNKKKRKSSATEEEEEEEEASSSLTGSAENGTRGGEEEEVEDSMETSSVGESPATAVNPPKREVSEAAERGAGGGGSGGSSLDDTVFRRGSRRRNSNRVYRKRPASGGGGERGGSSNDEDEREREQERDQEEEGEEEEEEESWPPSNQSRYFSSSSSSSSSSSLHSVFDANEMETDERGESQSHPRVLYKPRPRHKWFVMQEVINRQMGVSSRWQGPELFQQRCYGSLHAVQRLELMYKLEAHRGCVNTLNFNPSGSLLASASDDRKVALWDWALGKCIFSYDSGHSSNVFQAKFLPLSGDRHIVSCARDGQVRLAVLSGTGVCRGTRHLAQHRRPAHKIATQPETPHVFLSAGEDAVVMNLDVREQKPNSKLMFVKEGAKKVSLYSIHGNPINCHEFCVTGDDHFIRLYDKRKITSEGIPLRKFCPHHLLKTDIFIHVTCAVFNYNGTEILGSFNDEDIYLFDTRHSDGADYIHRYGGHRNSVTVKGVNFFGPRSEYIVSGSDCGHIYFWDKHTESIVQWMRGDEEGVVNCLEPHPQVPMLASSGLDYDIKIWVPSCEQEPTFDGLKSAVQFNHKARSETKNRSNDPWDSQMQWLWRQIRRFERHRSNNSETGGTSRVTWLTSSDRLYDANRRRGQEAGEAGEVAFHSENSSSSSDEGDEEQTLRPPECSPS